MSSLPTGNASSQTAAGLVYHSTIAGSNDLLSIASVVNSDR